LLALYIPAVYHILASEHELFDNAIFQTAFRIGLLPNNIFLAICSVYLLQNPGASLTATPRPNSKPSFQTAWANAELAILLVAGLLLMSNCAGFLAITVGMSGQRATAYLWAMMCIAIGALIGFLFAVPRVNPQVKTNSTLVTNTNIEQVSDWLTKILVGVGLINFKEIGAFLDRLSGELALSLGTEGAPVGKPLALSLIVYFFVVGLIQGYLLTRLFLSRQFASQTQGFEPARRAAGPHQRTSGVADVIVAENAELEQTSEPARRAAGPHQGTAGVADVIVAENTELEQTSEPSPTAPAPRQRGPQSSRGRAPRAGAKQTGAADAEP
jgi:hypothetical protein